MARYRPGDRVIYDGWILRILAVGERSYLVATDEGKEATYSIDALDDRYELAPPPFLRDGADRWLAYNYDGHTFVNCRGAFTSESAAQNAFNGGRATHIVRVNGQTGELSWAKGGPHG